MKKILLMLTFMVSAVIAIAQSKTVTGRITDEKGVGIGGAEVSTQDSKSKVVTQDDGSFSINVPNNAKTLRVYAKGFDTKNVTISGATANAKLTLTSADDIGEVVVTGLKNISKAQYTGAATKIGTQQIGNQAFGSLDQILQGNVAGVTSLTGSGQPGTSANVIIRGTSSISGGTDPLYIVDGIPVEQGVFQGLNPNDFASMEILRDAAAQALYGSRGAQGVIVVTTKRGVAGKPKVSFSTQAGVKQRPDFQYTMMSSPQLLKAQEDYGNFLATWDNGTNAISQDAVTRRNLPGWYYSKLNPAYKALSPFQQSLFDNALDSLRSINTNWNDVFLRTGTFNNSQISISGGSDKTTFYSSVALYNEEGITLRTNMKRATFRNNLDYRDNKISLSFSSTIGYTNRNFQQSTASNGVQNPFLISQLAVPYKKLFRPDGSVDVGGGGVSPQFGANNAYDATMRDLNYSDQLKATFSITSSYKISKYLTAGFTIGADFRETQNSNFGSSETYTRTISTNPRTRAGFQTEGLTRFIRTNIRPSLTYARTIKEDHDFDVSLYYEYIHEASKSMNSTGYGTDPKRPNTAATVIQGDASNQLYAVVGGSRSQSKLISGLVTGRYTYAKKYTLSVSYRNDGSSKLPVDTRWQGFFAVGGTWDVLKEKFMAKSNIFNTLRAKLSYGSAGNADNFPFGDFGYLTTYTQGTYGGIRTLIPATATASDLRWEKTYTLNFGIDFAMLKGRLYGDINLYDRRTKDLFVEKSLSLVAAPTFGSVTVNGGELQNKGFEWNINYVLLKGKKHQLTIFTNGAYNKNTVLDLGGNPSYQTGTELIKVGLPLGSHYLVKNGGIDAATGTQLYYDLNGKLTPNYSVSNSVQEFGTWEAPWKGGFGVNATYGNFDLNVLFAWQSGAYKFNNLEFFVENPVGFLQNGWNQATDLKFWTKPGDNATSPSPLYGTNFTSKVIHDASFVRLRNVQLSYNFANKLLQKTGFISRARLYFQANNIITWTSWKGIDPEAGASNINLGEFPNPKSFTGGVEITF